MTYSLKDLQERASGDFEKTDNLDEDLADIHTSLVLSLRDALALNPAPDLKELRTAAAIYKDLLPKEEEADTTSILKGLIAAYGNDD